MEGQSSLRKQAKFSQRILCNSRRILRSSIPNEHPGVVSKFLRDSKMAAENDGRTLYGEPVGDCKLATSHAYIYFLTTLTSSEQGLGDLEI